MQSRPLLAVLLSCTAGAPVPAASVVQSEPRQQQPTAARTLLDLPYVPDGVAKQKLDLYLPAAPGFETILYVHEGSLVGGDRKDADYPKIAAAFTAAGYAVAVMSYRLFPQVSWPAPAEDVAAAFAWVKKHIGEHGGSAERVYLVGHSSGATLVARLASDPRYLAPQQLKPTDIAGVVAMGTILKDEDFERRLASVPRERIDAAFTGKGFYAPYHDVETYVDSWPLHHVQAAMPPILITVAETEKVNPPCLAHALELQAAASKVGARVEVEVLPDRNHYSAMRRLPEPDDPTFARLLKFFASTRPK